MAQDNTIWIDIENGKYYQIPNGQTPAPGDVTLYTLSGKRQHVDAATIGQWEIPMEQAQAYLQLGALQLFSKQPTGEKAVASGEEAPQPPVRIAPQDLAWLFHLLAQAFADCIAEEENRLDNARQQLLVLRNKVQELGSDLDPIVVEMLPELIHNSYLSAENRTGFHRTAKLLQGIANQFDQLGNNPNNLLQMLTQMNQLIGGMSREETDEERQQRYREMARQAMPPVPRPDVNKMIADYKANLHKSSDDLKN
ncbi:MAG: hypothetical protein JXA21_27340 [Anaerolineae bacterium]|nr:hypothetical protein [Anaerolineae bacterium]